MHNLEAKLLPILVGNVELLHPPLHEKGKESLQQLHLLHTGFMLTRQPSLQLDFQDQFLHLDKFGVV